MEDKVAAVIVYKTFTKTTRLPNRASIFRDELYAISLTVVFIRCGKEKNFIIFSNSMSSLEALSGFKAESDLVYSIIKDYIHNLQIAAKLLSCVGFQVV